MELANLDSQQCRQTDPTGILVSQVCSLLLCSTENLALYGYTRLEFIYRFSETLKLTNVMQITSSALQAHVRMTSSKSNQSENLKLLHDALELLLMSLQNPDRKTTTGNNTGYKINTSNDPFNNTNPMHQLIASNDLVMQE